MKLVFAAVGSRVVQCIPRFDKTAACCVVFGRGNHQEVNVMKGKTNKTIKQKSLLTFRTVLLTDVLLVIDIPLTRGG